MIYFSQMTYFLPDVLIVALTYFKLDDVPLTWWSIWTNLDKMTYFLQNNLFLSYHSFDYMLIIFYFDVIT